jgi:hypothetical protein
LTTEQQRWSQYPAHYYRQCRVWIMGGSTRYPRCEAAAGRPSRAGLAPNRENTVE